ncbi:MAG: hypothetical protein U0V70_14390 [Terriglobia bacterium]
MPALVVSAGVTMDERIRNLMRERGHNDLLLEVNDPDLSSKMVQVLQTLFTQMKFAKDREDRGEKLEGHGSNGDLPSTKCAGTLP